ncbi:MAG: nucleotidyltransferase domain-containing protein [Ignavibacteriales bacterium]|nr:nucleotidyltransferase domain-containing protein [Ignavibacteriales bacterium]
MIINKVLDEVFSRWSNLTVLRALNKYGIGISGREVARVAGITVKNGFTALTDLENLGIVNRVRGGRDHLFTLNRNHFLVKEIIIPLFDVEEKFSEAIFDDIKKKLKKKCNSVYVFGSVALKEENVDSDLDLCVIYDKENQKEALEEAMYGLQSLLRKKYAVNASPFYISKAQFAIKAKNNKPPVVDVIKEGKFLFGKSIKALLNAKRI